MKRLLTLAIGCLAFACTASATQYTLVNGNFGNQTTPLSFADGDVIEVPTGANVTFTVTQTIPYDVTLNVYGELKMTPGNKILTIGSGSTINVYPGGTVSGNDAQQKIVIGTNTVYTGNSTVNNNGYTLTATGSSSGFSMGAPLPIKFVSFDAMLSSSNKVLLNWTAVNDGPATSFTVQQSKDGQNWMDMAEVLGEGQDHETISYTHELAVTTTTSRVMVYRIRYNGSNGQDVVYSQSRSLLLGRQTPPEPETIVTTNGSDIMVQVNNISDYGPSCLIVTTTDGRVIYNEDYTDGQPVTVTASIPGLYIVTITDHTSYRLNRKVTVQ